jgi:hypothetical protein
MMFVSRIQHLDYETAQDNCYLDVFYFRHSRTDWWWREKKGEYLPIVTKDEPTLLSYLRHQKIIGVSIASFA